MIEIYVFVNPLGHKCLSIEKQIMELAQQLDRKVHFRFVPIVNIRTVREKMKMQNQDVADIDLVNRTFEENYSMALDVKAVQLQGRKKGRMFLTNMQEAVNCHERNYSQTLVMEALKKIGADIDLFKKDRQNKLIHRAFVNDQQLAHEMHIRHVPSAVVYDFAHNGDGYLIDKDILVNTKQFYEEVFQHLFPGKSESCANYIANNYLKLMN